MTFLRGKPRPANSGRRKGTPNRGTVRERRLLAEGDDKTIVDGIIRDAKNADPEARRLYLRHLRPPPSRQTFVGPIDYVAPKTVAAAREAILTLGERLARNEISVEAHNALVDNLKAYLGDKAAEQHRKLDELEEALRGGGIGVSGAGGGG
jgi:hypothetical protein